MAAGFCFALLDAFSRMERAAPCSSLSAARVRSRSRPRRAPSSPARARPASILTESGSRIALRRLRRSALRSASGDGRCSYTPAPLRSLYGLVARPALFCPSDNTQSGSNNRNGQSNNRNPAFDNTQSGSRAKPERDTRRYRGKEAIQGDIHRPANKIERDKGACKPRTAHRSAPSAWERERAG